MKKKSQKNATCRNNSDQIKGRNFEVPGCGGFILTGYADNLEEYYDIGREIVCFEGIKDLVEKTQYYLNHDEERAAIAQAGYERTVHEHTYVHRFNEIFKQMGFHQAKTAEFKLGDIKPGKVAEVH